MLLLALRLPMGLYKGLAHNMLKIIEYICIWGWGVPAIYGLYKWQKLHTAAKIGTGYTLALFIGILISMVPVENNLWLFPLLYGVEALFAAWFFSQYKALKPYKLALYGLAALLLVYITIDNLTIESFNTPVSGMHAKAVLITSMVWSGLALYFMFKSKANVLLHKNFYFVFALSWFVGAILAVINVVYHDALWNYSKQIFAIFTSVLNILTAVQIVLFTYGLSLKSACK
jgi:hypothetical protein